MEKVTLYKMSSPYRGEFRINGYWFGEGEKTVAIVGAMRGDEIQQQYICAKLVQRLTEIEANGGIIKGKRILVIPSCNPFSMNVSRRFWTMDNTDINRMFPGYDKGETTQRIAAAIFKSLEGFEYGLQMASFYIPGDFVPHVRMLKTGYESIDDARLFGLPFVTTRVPLPFDTTLLNYNWQIWNTKAFSVYAGQTNYVENATSDQTIDAILRFLNRIGVSDYKVRSVGYDSIVMEEEDLINMRAHRAGIFYRVVGAGQNVHKDDVLARILDPNDCSVLEEIKAPDSGVVFFAHNRPLVLEHNVIYRIERL